MIPIPLIIQIGLGMFAVSHIVKSIHPKQGPQGPQGEQGPQGQHLLGEDCIRNKNRIEDLSKQITLQHSTVADNKRVLKGQQLLGETCIRNRNRIEALSEQIAMQRDTAENTAISLNATNRVSESRRIRMARLMKYMNTSKSDIADNNKKVDDLKKDHKSQDDMSGITRTKVSKLLSDTADSRGIAKDTRKRLSILEEAMSEIPVGMRTIIPKDGLSRSSQ